MGKKTGICLVQCTGDWEINTDNLEKVEGIPNDIERDEGIFGDRMFPYIALPKRLSSNERENILWWGKSWSKPVEWRDYYVYQVRIKPWYVKNLAKEVFASGGFFLVERGKN